MPRRKHWQTIDVVGATYHWKVSPPDFQRLYPPSADPHEVVVKSEGDRSGKILRVRFPYNASSRVTVTSEMVLMIIEAAIAMDWGTACSETRYWLGDALASYDQWVDQLRSSGR